MYGKNNPSAVGCAALAAESEANFETSEKRCPQARMAAARPAAQERARNAHFACAGASPLPPVPASASTDGDRPPWPAPAPSLCRRRTLPCGRRPSRGSRSGTAPGARAGRVRTAAARLHPPAPCAAAPRATPAGAALRPPSRRPPPLSAPPPRRPRGPARRAQAGTSSAAPWRAPSSGAAWTSTAAGRTSSSPTTTTSWRRARPRFTQSGRRPVSPKGAAGAHAEGGRLRQRARRRDPSAREPAPAGSLHPSSPPTPACACGPRGCHQWVNYFLHSGFLEIEGLKMSKSLKNFITIRWGRPAG